MNISLTDQFKMFASNVMCDVCTYFLQKLCSIEGEYTSQCSFLYSNYGQKTLIQCLHDLPLEFFIELKDYATSQLINNDVFDEIVSIIIEKSGWITGRHATFYETCGKIIILGIVAMDHGCFDETKIHDEITKMAEKAYSMNILDNHYDKARKNAQSMIHTIFKIQGTDINEFVTQLEKELGFEEFLFPEGLVNLIKSLAPQTNDLLLNSENFRDMNRIKFDFLVKRAIDRFKRIRNRGNGNNNTNFLKYFSFLVIQVGCFSLYCAKNSYKAGVQHGFDYITEIILTEKRRSLETHAQ